jgi:hypothetical protein
MSLFISDKVEKPLEIILADLQKRLPAILDKLERLVDESRAEVAAIKAIRERTFGP